MPLHYIEEHAFDSGFMRDVVSSQLPPGALYDAVNVLFDKPGIARQRLGHSAISALGSVAAVGSSLGFAYSADSTPIEELYTANGRTSHVYVINKATGAATDLGGSGAAAAFGRSVRHFGFAIFPYILVGGNRSSVAYAGQTSTTSFSNTVAGATMAVNNTTITLAGADTTTNIRVGATAQFANAGPASMYFGRVVSILTSTQFTVSPTPPVSLTGGGAGFVGTAPAINSSGGGACAASFQNRLLFGNTGDIAASTLIGNDRRVYYSPLPTESAGNTLTPVIYGATFLQMASWPFGNFFDVPGADPIVGMEPVSDNELLILTTGRPVVFRGQLITILGTTDPTVTYDITELDKYANCASDHSIQRTPRGVVWAGTDGVFVYTGNGNTENLLDGRNATYWRDLARSTTFAVHGSAYVRGHYIVAATSGGTSFQLCLNLASREVIYSRLTNVDIVAAVARPSNASQVWAARWWDTNSAAPNFTNGQIIRLESMFDTYVAGATTTDSDGTSIGSSITTRVLAGDPGLQKMFHAGTVRYQAAMTGANLVVTAQSKIDASDITAQMTRTLGNLSSTETRLITAATNATPIVCTSNGHGLQNQDFVDIDGGTGLTNMNGQWRITVINANSFSLNGSIGNGAYGASSAVVKRLTEADYSMTTLDSGQGVSITISSAGAVNYWELHGLRLAVLQRPPVYSA